MKPGPIAAAVALAAFVVWRRRKLEPTLLAGGVVVVLGLLLYGSGLVELPNAEQVAEDLGETLGRWTYLLVPALAFLETGAFVGLLAPGETAMVLGGVVAGQGRISLATLIGLVWVAAILGDLVSFWLGRRLGRAFLVKHGPKVQITEERLHQVEGFYDRHGGKAVLLGRFVGLVRAVSPFLAGSSGMPLKRFVPYDVLGAGLWSATFLVLGFLFWQSFDTVLEYAEKGAFALGTTIVVVVAAVWLARWLRDPEHREALRVWVHEHQHHRVFGPLLRVLLPLWRGSRRPRRFVWARITPGDLGLEVTTLIAVLAAGTFALVSPLATLATDAYTLGDLRALEWANDIRTASGDDVAKVVTDLGSLAATAGVVLGAAIWLAMRREVAAALALVGGMTLTFAVVHLVKAAKDRPRPIGSLVETSFASFPSGHAAYGVAWIAVTVALTRVVPGFARATALVVGAVVVAVAVALTRIYLRAHFVSDVVGGLGTGAACFALAGLVAVIGSYHRRGGASGTMPSDRA
ncbi:VTT domain-containing protein [Conexibacter sp. SYSU D00693]|uniref:VTT domain-containing protein n=1 Tax=Conexibacter sp. SYSU D00693 TaxID=2812560 RepID=UPI00196B97F8|nr:VTT domain-containing protein [Conexibacter sp. SYSU D00693]